MAESEKIKYSKKELEEFIEIIVSKLTEAKTDLDLLNDTMSLKDNNGTDDTSPTFKLIED